MTGVPYRINPITFTDTEKHVRSLGPLFVNTFGDPLNTAVNNCLLMKDLFTQTQNVHPLDSKDTLNGFSCAAVSLLNGFSCSVKLF